MRDQGDREGLFEMFLDFPAPEVLIGFGAIMSAMITESWTAFESLTTDLWRVAWPRLVAMFG